MSDFSTLIKESRNVVSEQPAERTIQTIEPTASKEPSKIEPPFSDYEQVKGKPYSVDYFKIGFWNELSPELDVSGIKGKVKTIEKYVNEEIKRLGFNNEVSNYDDIISGIKSALHINHNEQIEQQLTKIHDYIKILRKQHKAEEERRAFVEAFNGKFPD
jgi:hypothetical protein